MQVANTVMMPVEEAESLRRDAARYRWLVRDLISWDEGDGVTAYILDFGTFKGASVDAAIDAARAADSADGATT